LFIIPTKTTAGARQGVWVVKIQPPLDVSSDSAGGIQIAQMVRMTLSNRSASNENTDT
jgi:hypothetical protein